MRPKNELLVLVLGASIAAVCTGACKKSSEVEQKEAAEAELRSAEKTTKGKKEAIDEHNDYLAAVRREQLDLRARLQQEIDAIDKKLADLKVDLRKEHGDAVIDPKSKDAKKVDELVKRRQTLEADVATIERSDERGWDEIKANIEADLGRGRPGKI